MAWFTKRRIDETLWFRWFRSLQICEDFFNELANSSSSRIGTAQYQQQGAIGKYNQANANR